MTTTTATRRGTSNSNVRGSSYTRRIRKAWMLATFDPELGPTRARCYRCKRFLGWATLTVDRIIPGCLGGTYRRENVRPACMRCNASTGGALATRKSQSGRVS